MNRWFAFLAFAQDPWAGVKAWRERRAKWYTPSKPTFDAYPGLSDEPRMTEYIEARDAFGRLLRERVDLKGYGIEHVNFQSERWRRDFILAHQAARKVLDARLRLARIQKDKRDKERAERELERVLERDARGQAIVEVALTLPILLLVILGGTELGFLVSDRFTQTENTFTVATWAAEHNGESWNSVANRLLPGCEVTMTTQHDLIDADVTCRYVPHVTSNFWDGLRIHTHGTAALRSVEPSPTPGATP